MSQYNSTPKSRPQQKLDTSGSFGFKSSQFSQKNNNSLDYQVKNIDPSLFNESSIRKLNTSESGEFIYFQNDSLLSQLGNELKTKKKQSLKENLKQRKKTNSIDYSKSISFQDSLRKSHNNGRDDDYQIKEYGTGKSNLPPTLKKPKFGFKISQTAQSSEIIREVGEQYQLELNQNNENIHKKVNIDKASKGSLKGSQISIKRKNKQTANESISSIRKPIQQPSIVSIPTSSSNQLSHSMNFRSVFKNKVQKASSINSSLSKRLNTVKSNKSIYTNRNNQNSLSKNSFIEKQVKITQLKQLHQLQNKLGQLKHQNKKIIQYMIERDGQIQKLKQKKRQIQSQDPYAVVKENELMKAFLNKNNKSKQRLSSNQYKQIKSPIKLLSGNLNSANLHSAKSLKQISVKKSSQISSLHDYDIKEYKFKVQPLILTRSQKKLILSNRGMILSDKYLDVGYSLKQNILTIYLTLKRDIEQMRVKLEQNSLVLSQNVDRVFKNSSIGKQIKFKTQIKSTKIISPQEQFVLSCLKVSLSLQQNFQSKIKQYKIQLPIIEFNIAKQIELSSIIGSSKNTFKSNPREVYKTQSMVGCRQMIKDPQSYLMRLFPLGFYQQDQNVLHVAFQWKSKIQKIKIKVKERSFILEGEGNPNKGTFQLIRTIASILIQQRDS